MHSSSLPADRLRHELGAANAIVAFTGAGISTESGIPDFRSPGGIWEKYQPIDFSDYMRSEDIRVEAWRRKLGTRGTLSTATPNAGHEALARLHRQGRLRSVITQNVDGLHQASGIPDEKVIELHGNATYATCLSCAKHYQLDPLLETFERTQSPPACDCGGIIKSATVSFGQPMPQGAMADAETECLACDLILVLGTSLAVYPAAGFPRLAKAHGARLVIVNRDPTDQDGVADLVLQEEIGPLLAAAVVD